MFGSLGSIILTTTGVLAVFAAGHWSGRSPSRLAAWIRRQIDTIVDALRGD
jgi:K+ transporter